MNSSPATACPVYAWALLIAPNEQDCQVDVARLWGRYLILGGTMSLARFRAALNAEILIDGDQRERIAQVLREHLCEHEHCAPRGAARGGATWQARLLARWPWRPRGRYRR